MSGVAMYGDQLGSRGGRLRPGLPGGGGPIGPGGSIGAGDVRSPGGLTGAAVGGQLNAGGKLGSSGGRLLLGLPSAGGLVDVGIFRSPVAGDPLSAGPFRSPTGLTSHAGSPIGPGGVGFTSPPGLIAGSPVDPRGVRSSPGLIGAAGNGVAGNTPIFMSRSGATGHFAIGSLQSLLHHVSSSAAAVGRVPATSICDGSDQLLSAQSSLAGSHVQTCGYSSWNDGMHQVTASSPIDQEVDDAPGQDSSDSDTEDPLQDEHIDADAEDSDGSSEDVVPINDQSTLQGSANGSSEDAVPIDNQSTLQGPADEDALQYEIVSIPLGDDGHVSNKLGYKKSKHLKASTSGSKRFTQ